MSLSVTLFGATVAEPHLDIRDNAREKQDGRVVRSSATRRKILDSTSMLLVEGIQAPTAREIADAAKITTRTLFRHFKDMDSLFATLISEAQTRIAAVMDEPLPESTNWRAGLEHIIERRVRVYELLLPLYVSSAWLRGLSSENQQYAVQRRRSRLAQVLPKKMSKNKALFEALDATLSMEYWYSLRRAQNLDVDKARQALRLALNLMTQNEAAR